MATVAVRRKSAAWELREEAKRMSWSENSNRYLGGGGVDDVSVHTTESCQTLDSASSRNSVKDVAKRFSGCKISNNDGAALPPGFAMAFSTYTQLSESKRTLNFFNDDADECDTNSDAPKEKKVSSASTKRKVENKKDAPKEKTLPSAIKETKEEKVAINNVAPKEKTLPSALKKADDSAKDDSKETRRPSTLKKKQAPPPRENRLFGSKISNNNSALPPAFAMAFSTYDELRSPTLKKKMTVPKVQPPQEVPPAPKVEVELPKLPQAPKVEEEPPKPPQVVIDISTPNQDFKKLSDRFSATSTTCDAENDDDGSITPELVAISPSSSTSKSSSKSNLDFGHNSTADLDKEDFFDDDDFDDGISFQDMAEYLEQAQEERKKLKRTSSTRSSVTWSESNHTVEIMPLDNESLDDCFWTDDELSTFRYEAFVESLGLDPNDYDSDCEGLIE